MSISRSRCGNNYKLQIVVTSLLLVQSACETPVTWKTARSSFFGAPQSWKEWYPPGQFGDLYVNSCGYTDHEEGVKASNEMFAFPTDAVGSLSDVLPDHTGGCGRCYEIRCKDGYILDTYDSYMTIRSVYHLPRLGSKDLEDPEGRKWPGVPHDKDKELMWTTCRDENESIVITIVDSCPCVYRGGKKQRNCCGPIDHIGLSFWAFNKLAHPLYGMMMMEYRPVDCTTHLPLVSRTSISTVIYRDHPEAGWAWNLYNSYSATLMAEGKGRGSSSATCARLRPGGGLSFWCKGCHEPGFQPFNAHALSFWVKINEYDYGSPSRGFPELSLFLSQMHVATFSRSGAFRQQEIICNGKPNLKDYNPKSVNGDWFQFQIQMNDFRCTGDLELAGANRLVFENSGGTVERDADFCADDIEILS